MTATIPKAVREMPTPPKVAQVLIEGVTPEFPDCPSYPNLHDQGCDNGDILPHQIKNYGVGFPKSL